MAEQAGKGEAESNYIRDGDAAIHLLKGRWCSLGRLDVGDVSLQVGLVLHDSRSN